MSLLVILKCPGIKRCVFTVEWEFFHEDKCFDRHIAFIPHQILHMLNTLWFILLPLSFMHVLILCHRIFYRWLLLKLMKRWAGKCVKVLKTKEQCSSSRKRLRQTSLMVCRQPAGRTAEEEIRSFNLIPVCWDSAECGEFKEWWVQQQGSRFQTAMGQ